LRDLDEEAVHLVELHPQVGDAGARALTGLHLQQEAVGVVLDGATDNIVSCLYTDAE
jgi:hypothetical protein